MGSCRRYSLQANQTLQSDFSNEANDVIGDFKQKLETHWKDLSEKEHSWHNELDKIHYRYTAPPSTDPSKTLKGKEKAPSQSSGSKQQVPPINLTDEPEDTKPIVNLEAAAAPQQQATFIDLTDEPEDTKPTMSPEADAAPHITRNWSRTMNECSSHSSSRYSGSLSSQ